MPLLHCISHYNPVWGSLALMATLAAALPATAQSLAEAAGDTTLQTPVSEEFFPETSPGFVGESDAPSLPESYVLGPGDRIRIDIFNVPEFSGPENGVHEVLVDGTLSLPMVGIIDVDGLTLEQTRQVLAQNYSRLLTRPPQLTVTLLNSRPVRIAVAGEVNRPGTYTAEFLPESSSGGGNTEEVGRQWPTLTQVIQEAGGITQQANIRFVEIRRPQRNAPDAVMVANLWDLIRTGDISQDIRLRDGDTVVIPTAVSPSPSELVEISDANFSPSEIPIQVVGEVAQPGTVQVPANATLNQAILAAGGFENARARTSTVELVRLNPDGTVERRELEVDLSVAANNDNNPILRPDDVVMVDRNTVARAGDALGVVLSPITAIAAILSIFGL